MTQARFTITVATLLIQCTLTAAASAQPWLEAHKGGEYAKAANLLHEIVSDQDNPLRGGDPAALRLLAQMYKDGRGVPRDPVGACSLAQDAQMAAQMAPWQGRMETMDDFRAYQAFQREAEDFSAALCGGLSVSDFLTASKSRAGCYGFGMPEETILLGTRFVRISRAGIVPASTLEGDMGGLFGCYLAIARARIRTIAAPEDAAAPIGPRHFVELFAWRRNHIPAGSDSTFALIWQIFEIQGKEMLPRLPEIILAASSSIQEGIPPGVEARVTFQMVRSGHVLWRVEGAPPKRGWLMLPDTKESR
jgi:hypothetical protein